ncbi:tRNA (N6-isopentenyl adenosine(37)-C2)-methylthiotransferase MiaB [Acidocella aminolytica]|uniref:tRNA-2-methylthio-N(6)-dimethylallyladenosine synthase n=1 Tax=Acidocella aminolytica 101 = DSM 11237 TaxID=1120923 RepID=A0A0D6PE16_9PROT|nr:tRNA (N6-isopentenyl adenosine(37)-C2)-methylthiotransferase MiaB [Acidocella aminolytica]GAN79907.1 tRNA 2-methylthioadenosine synthase MiaB [Acidocella aminolytica 101 = DSM 11237]GBQ41043.1 tRNA 2-methylthioadenosine synthase MiaB [Acidocella aminolytica 101 = DSM 11237]SHE59704.1 tRNA-2-methylthio-N6-dimethylallyladenosine synthase [Acidocella aminolytica 101 = DSM 11237]
MTTTDRTPRKLHVVTHGCQMNVYDSARMTDLLRPLGYETVAAPEGADMVIINTCHIRERAEEKVFSQLGRLRKMKEEQGGNMMIAVTGCVAQAEGEVLAQRAPFVDLVVGPQAYHRLPELIAQAHRKAGAVIDTDFPVEQKFDYLPDDAAPQGVVSFLSIQEGCDKFCSFCVVPYTRGAEASRPVASVLAEAKRMVALGAREIALLGQNVNAYHGEGPDGSTWSLAQLMDKMAEIEGLERIRYTTSHPNDMGEDLILAHRDNIKLMPFLHLPVQSGSDKILRAMNRKHKADDFRRIVERLRHVRPDMAMSSDFITGHPGETDADFEETMKLVRETGFALAYSFKYSPRPGTPAASLPQVEEAVKDARLQELQGLLREQQNTFNASIVGLETPVLFTGSGRHPGQIAGRSLWLQPVVVEHETDLTGKIRMVKITRANPNSLSGTLLDKELIAA